MFISFDPIFGEDAQSNEKSIFRFLFFELVEMLVWRQTIEALDIFLELVSSVSCMHGYAHVKIKKWSNLHFE